MFEMKLKVITDYVEHDAPGPFVRMEIGGEKFDIDPARAKMIGQSFLQMAASAENHATVEVHWPLRPVARAR